ncbi:MAG: hypothetical protein ACLPYS_01060 [Vulcanimicrobiaceae bacterium]|jgi:hypothetical protein
MAVSDRQRLLERALALPTATSADFQGGRRAPAGVDPSLLKIINDTALRTKLVDARVSEGLQSPKGPQKIASIIRVYPEFDAPLRSASPSARSPRASAGPSAPSRNLPTVDEMERLIARIREVETEVARELATQVDERIDQLKRSLGELSGTELEHAYRELGEALEQKRALRSQIRFETFQRVEHDTEFAPRAHLRLLARG